MKKRRKTQRRISSGTLIMLLLTALALAGCAAFMMMIAGGEMNSRAHETAQIVKEAGIALASDLQIDPFAWETEHPAAKTTSAPQGTPAQAPQVRAQEVSTFTLAAAGTVYAPKPVRNGALSEAGEYDFAPVFAGLGDALGGADLSIVTLETMTAGEEKGYGNYNAPVQLLSALRGAGVNLVSLSTERALDKGYEGLEITASELTARGMMHVGVKLNDGAAATTDMIGIGGVQVAVLAYTYGLSDEGKESATQSERGAVNLLETQRVVGEIRQARADGANVVIVLAHWGTKNKQETPEEVRRMARTMAEAGADVILGTHPNVVQGTQRLTVTRADGLEYDAVVCYSLGSLLTDARMMENTAGMIAKLPISYDPMTRRVSLGSLACLPVYIARQKQDTDSVYRVIDVENAQALGALDAKGQEEALQAAKLVREITGQSDMEKEGQG